MDAEARADDHACPGTAQRSRNPPDTAAFNGAVGGNRRPSGRRGCQSFESRNYPGEYLRHYNAELWLTIPTGAAPTTPRPVHRGHHLGGGGALDTLSRV
ncbi:AbfB domain-containing protein [Streptomyces griseoincarnatus]